MDVLDSTAALEILVLLLIVVAEEPITLWDDEVSLLKGDAAVCCVVELVTPLAAPKPLLTPPRPPLDWPVES